MQKTYYNKVARIISQLEELVEQRQEQIDAREETFSNRSEAWQESEKGEAFQAITDTMQDDADAIQNAIDYLLDIEEDF